MSRRFVLPVVRVGGEIRLGVFVFGMWYPERARGTYQHSRRLHELGRHLTSILTIILAPILRCIRSVPSHPFISGISTTSGARAEGLGGGGHSRRLR
jgi:hypothetical protein